MNKLLSKIVGAALGLTMAIGVSVAVGNNREAVPVHAAVPSGNELLFTINFKDNRTDSSSALTAATFYSSGVTSVTDKNGSIVTSTFSSVGISGNPSKVYPGTGGLKCGSNKNAASFSLNIPSAYQAKFTYAVINCTNATRSITITAGGGSDTLASGNNSFENHNLSISSTSTATTLDVSIASASKTAAYIASIAVYKAAVTDVTVTFNANGHGTAPSSQTITSGGKVTQPTAPTATGWTFGGWYKEQACTNAWNFSTDTVSTNTTLWAKWTATTYSISYTLDGGTHGDTHPTSGTYDTAFSVSAPAKTGYTFTGWTVTSGLNASTAKWGTTSSPSTAISSSSTLCVNGTNAVYFKNINAASTAVTLTANWSINSYTVGGSISNGSLSSTANVNYNDALDISIVPDTANNYTYPSSIESVTMGGTAYAGYTYNSTNGKFYIEHVTGNVVIDAECPYDGQTFAINVSVENGTYSGDSEIGEEGEASVTITPNSGYKVPLSKSDIIVTNAIEWDYTRTSNSSATISLLGAEDVVSISAECVALQSYSIGFTSEEHFTYSGASSIQEDGSATLTIVPNEGYYQPSDVTVSGATKSWVQETGALTLSNPTGNVSITYTPVERTLTGIAISSSSGSFTLGDVFTKPTVTATYNVGGNEDVTNDATATGGGLVDGILTEAGTKTITISYGGYSKTYEATVTAIEPSDAKYVKVTSTSNIKPGDYLIVYETDGVAFNGGLSTLDATNNKISVSINKGEIAYSETTNAAEFTLASVEGGYSIKSTSGYYIGRTSSSNGMNTSTSEAYVNTIIISDENAVISGSGGPSLKYNSASDQARFRYYGTGQKSIQLYKYQDGVAKTLKWITAEVKPGTYYQGNSVTSSDFTVTAHYDDGKTSTPTTDITVTNGELVNIGANEVTLTYGGKSCKVSVNAIEQTATLTSLAWAQGEYAIIDGQSIDFSELGTITAEYDDGDSYATKSINQCSVATYTKSGNDYVKAADLTDGDTLTSTSHGKYLGISYTEGVVTKYAYSSAPIYVVEEINNVRRKEATTSWSKIASIKEGDVVTFVNETENVVSTSMGSNIINATSYSTSVSTTFTFTVGTAKVGDNTYYTFHNANGYLGNHSTGTSGNNNAYLDTEIDTDNNMNYFTVSFDGDGNVTIKSVYATERTLQLRKGTPDRFCFYGSEQDPVQLYKSTNSYTPTGEPISNTNATAQKVALEYATHFVTEMNCKADGTTADVANKWSELATDFSNWFINSTSEDFKNLTSEQVAHAFELFEYADAVDGGDTLQNMLSKYEYIIAKYNKLGYGLEDFLHTNTDRPVVQSTSVRIGLFGIINSTNMTAIIIVISLVSLTAVGGYFFLRTRKED